MFFVDAFQAAAEIVPASSYCAEPETEDFKAVTGTILKSKTYFVKTFIIFSVCNINIYNSQIVGYYTSETFDAWYQSSLLGNLGLEQNPTNLY